MKVLFMKNKNTQLRRFKAGTPKSAGLNSSRKNFSPRISTNYKMMLELYCLNKKEAASKGLKYQRLGARTVSSTAKPAFSISAAIVSFFEESFLLLKKVKPRMAMATVTE